MDKAGFFLDFILYQYCINAIIVLLLLCFVVSLELLIQGLVLLIILFLSLLMSRFSLDFLLIICGFSPPGLKTRSTLVLGLDSVLYRFNAQQTKALVTSPNLSSN